MTCARSVFIYACLLKFVFPFLPASCPAGACTVYCVEHTRRKETILISCPLWAYFLVFQEVGEQRNTNEGSNSMLYVPCIILQCVDEPTRCNTSYELSLFSIILLYMFRTITSPSSGASSHKLYNALQASLAVAWMYIHATARLSCTNIPMRYTVYEMMLLMMDW